VKTNNTTTVEDSSFMYGSMSRLRSWLHALGPGLITAALVFGPSKVTITSKQGAEYGYALLWNIVVAIFFMMIFTSMSARIGLASDRSFVQLIREKWGNTIAILAGIGVFLVCASFQAGNCIGIGISIAELSGTDPVVWIIVFTLIGIGLLFFRSFYKVLEKVMIGLVILMLVSFLFTLFLVKPNVSEVVNGLYPTIPEGSMILIIAFMASCFSIVGACYQCYLIQEKKRSGWSGTQRSSDSFTGILILGIMSAIVMICAAAILHPKNIRINSGADMSRVLEPAFGKYAAAVFLTGLFGAAFSSLIGNASLGGTLLGDALGFGSKFNSKPVKIFVAAIMFLGAAMAIVFGKIPIQLMIFAQSITILIVPFIGIAMFQIANDGKIMGELKNKPLTKLSAALGLLLLIALALKNVQTLFF
jgi:manganese transport protein